MELVCLDTNMLIWGLKSQASQGQEANIHKAKHLIQSLASGKAVVMVPSVVLAELLDGIPSGERQAFVARMQHLFRVVPFDDWAALEYARLFESAHNKVEGKPREAIKVDRMIVATAIAVKANAIYSEDNGVHAIGKKVIDVRHLPVPPPQQVKLPLEDSQP